MYVIPDLGLNLNHVSKMDPQQLGFQTHYIW